MHIKIKDQIQKPHKPMEGTLNNASPTTTITQQQQQQEQQQNQYLRKDNSLSHQGGGLNAFYWCQIFVLDSVVV